MKRLRHKYGLCGGFEPFMAGKVAMLRSGCIHCVNEFDLIKAQWCGGFNE